MAHKLHIIDVSKDANTGRITVEARIVDEDHENPSHREGAVERWHIEALEIATKYNGKAVLWLEHIGREMSHSHHQRTAAHTDIQCWRGKKMDIKP